MENGIRQEAAVQSHPYHAAAFRQIVITSLSDMSRTAQCKKVKNDDGSSAYYGSIACAEL